MCRVRIHDEPKHRFLLKIRPTLPTYDSNENIIITRSVTSLIDKFNGSALFVRYTFTSCVYRVAVWNVWSNYACELLSIYFYNLSDLSSLRYLYDKWSTTDDRPNALSSWNFSSINDSMKTCMKKKSVIQLKTCKKKISDSMKICIKKDSDSNDELHEKNHWFKWRFVSRKSMIQRRFLWKYRYTSNQNLKI